MLGVGTRGTFDHPSVAASLRLSFGSSLVRQESWRTRDTVPASRQEARATHTLAAGGISGTAWAVRGT